MPTLGTQNIATSYLQLLKADTLNPISATLQAITSGDSSGTSALALSTTEVQSTGSFTVASASRLLGSVTFGTSFTASTGTATIGTLSVGTQSVGTSTIGISTVSTLTVSTANLPLQLGNITFGSNITASTGTATIGTLSASTATISTATIPNILGVSTFATGFTSSTGTNTLGTIASTTINNTGLGTVGTLQVGASGPKLTTVSFGTAAFTSATVSAHNVADATTGSFGLTGVALGDMIIGSLNSLGSATGTVNIGLSLYPAATNFVEYSIQNQGTTAGTIPAGIFFATALRFTA
jgi:hypothetical protein